MPRHGRSGSPYIGTPARRTLCHCASSRGRHRSQQQSEFHQEVAHMLEEQQAIKFSSAAGAPRAPGRHRTGRRGAAGGARGSLTSTF
eukprot:1466098-Alexandrium_andersonii.AAC.1